MHDLTAVRIEGIDLLLDAYPDVTILVDAGYQGLARDDHHGQVSAPPLKPGPAPQPDSKPAGNNSANTSPRNASRSSTPSPSRKWWRVLQRFTGRHELLPETINAVAGLVSDKTAGLTW
jgi:hypothetical protein